MLLLCHLFYRRNKVVAAAIILQRAARIMITSQVERLAATQIQRAWRVHNIVKSAITIQAAVRGRQAGHSFPIQRNAVSTLQRSARFMLTRTR